MAILFDHKGYVNVSGLSAWTPTVGNFDIIFDLFAPATGIAATGLLHGNTENGGRDWLVLRSADFQARFSGAYRYPVTDPIPFGTRFEITLRGREVPDTPGSFTYQVLINGAGGEPFLEPQVANFSILHLGDAEGRHAEEGVVFHRVQIIDLDSAANSRDYQFSEGTGAITADSGPGGHTGTLTNFYPESDPWYVESFEPSVAIAGTLVPGQPFEVSYTNFTAIPASPVIITAPEINGVTPPPLSVPVTINNTVTEGKNSGTATGTYPPLPVQGSAQLLPFTNPNDVEATKVTIQLGTT